MKVRKMVDADKLELALERKHRDKLRHQDRHQERAFQEVSYATHVELPIQTGAYRANRSGRVF